MHHSHTHTKRNNNTKHIPSQTNYHPPTHKQQSTKEKNIVILQININGFRNKIEELKKTRTKHPTGHHHNTRNKTHTESENTLLQHHTHRQRAQTKRWIITLIKDVITFTNINIPNAINTHNTELQLIKIHICKTKDITVANTYFPPRDTTSSHYTTVTQTSHTAYYTSPTYQTQYAQVT